MKTEIKKLLNESGHGDLYSEKSYQIAVYLTKEAEKSDRMLREFFRSLSGMKAKYIHDLIVKNKEIIRNEGNI
jgi:hypothetical protein